MQSEMGKDSLKDDDRRGKVCKWKWKMVHGHLIIWQLTPLTTKKQPTNFSSASFQKMLNPSYTILRIPRLEGKQYRSR